MRDQESNLFHFISNTQAEPEESPEEIANMLMDGFEVTALTAKRAYEEYKKAGFNEEQAFELTKIFVDRGFDDV